LWAFPHAVSGQPEPAAAGMELNSEKNRLLFSTYFGQYGRGAKDVVSTSGGKLAFRKPANTLNAVEAGLYSYFVVASDFDIRVNLELVLPDMKRIDTGVSLGIALDAADDSEHFKFLWRQSGVGSGEYVLVHGIGSGPSAIVTERTIGSSSKKGRLEIVRKGKLVTCRFDDGLHGVARTFDDVDSEAGREFSVRLFAQLPPRDYAVAVAFSNFVAKAVAISGGSGSHADYALNTKLGTCAVICAAVMVVGVMKWWHRQNRSFP
jgi:hypothetical protein